MIKANDDNRDISRYRLNKADGGAVVLEGRYWKTMAVYMSNICIAVRLGQVSRAVNDGSAITAKDELYAMMRSIRQLALEHDFMRPVAGVLSKDEFTGPFLTEAEVRRWVGDQDWHRGAFTLFVEANQDAVTNRLTDLLEPFIEELNPDAIQPKDSQDMAKCLQNRFQTESSMSPSIVKEVRELLHIVTQAINPDKSKPAQDINQELAEWIDGVVRQANKIHEGK